MQLVSKEKAIELNGPGGKQAEACGRQDEAESFGREAESFGREVGDAVRAPIT